MTCTAYCADILDVMFARDFLRICSRGIKFSGYSTVGTSS